ncbi:MAG: MBL fold metallo-hydrolase [Micropepsaceae bacterium]
MQWTVGRVKITSIVEMELADLNELIVGAKRSAVQGIDWLVPRFAWPDGTMTGLIQCFVIETPARTIVVDTCIGDGKDRRYFPHWHRLASGFLERFNAAGFATDKVDCVLCTHMHVDHVGWNTFWDGSAWSPTFPRARYLFARKEFEYWQDENRAARADPGTATSSIQSGALRFAHTQVQVHEDSVTPIFEHGLADIVATDHVVCDEVRLLPTPGHTPGHVSIAIASEGHEAVITGDCIHHPCQLARPDWPTFADHDRAKSIDTRLELFSGVAARGVLLVGSHFSRPTAGFIEADGEGYRLKDVAG